MMGAVGLALLAMRWSVSELELNLWSLLAFRGEVESDPEKQVSNMFNPPTPAPLDKPDLLSLAQAEQGVEVERKIQVMEDAWSPWFEGLAVFAELAADPSEDILSYSPVISVIYNLCDLNLASEAKEYGISIEDAVVREWKKAEERYSEAICSNGRHRLRTYLDAFHKTYLAGYFTVRSVVSAWRQTLGKHISGVEAFKVLLHVTRFGAKEAVPDAALPLEKFRETVISRHVEWLTGLTSISKDDLLTILSKYDTLYGGDTGYEWTKGRLQKGATRDEEHEALLKWLSNVASRALESMCGEFADADRVAEWSNELRYVMSMVAEGLDAGEEGNRLFTSETIDFLLPGMTILPLGAVRSPFWMLKENKSITCLIRTSEKDRKHGDPSYDLVGFPVSADSFAALEAKVLSGGDGRMTVTRVTDLAQDPEADFYMGDNYIVFQYEDWMHIQRRGLRFGDESVSDSVKTRIEARLASSATIAAHNTLTGESHPCARRTRDWIQRNQWLINVEGIEVDIQPWANRVAAVADSVVKGAEKRDWIPASKALLQFVLGDNEAATRITEEGLNRLRDADSEAVSNLATILDLSSRRSVESLPSIDLQQLSVQMGENVSSLLEKTTLGWDVIRPAFLRNQNYEHIAGS